MMYYFDLVPQVCISFLFIMATICVGSILLSATLRVNRFLRRDKIRYKKPMAWETRKIETTKHEDKKKKDA